MTEKQRRFVKVYLESDDPLKAYEEAGYVTEHSDGKPRTYLRMLAVNVLRGKAVAEALLSHTREIAEREEVERVMSRAHVKAEHIRLMKICEANGDLSNATRNLEDVGKMGAMYADVLVSDPVRQQEYTRIEQEEALRVTAFLLAQEDEPLVFEHQPREALPDVDVPAGVPVQAQAVESPVPVTLRGLERGPVPRVDPDSPESAQGHTGAATQGPSTTGGHDMGIPGAGDRPVAEQDIEEGQEAQQGTPQPPKGAGGLGKITFSEM